MSDDVARIARYYQLCNRQLAGIPMDEADMAELYALRNWFNDHGEKELLNSILMMAGRSVRQEVS